MGHSSHLSRGDARRNARLTRLRAVVRPDLAVLAIDLADDTQAVVVTDHDSRVLARRTVRCRAWQLDEVLRWGQGLAVRHGFAGVVVACEPTGHRWRILAEHAAELGLGLVCVQPLLVGRGREAEDLTRDKSDGKDAVVIARLVTERRCYLPERPDAAWARLRQLGARRAEQTTAAGAARQRLRDLLECAWPAVLATAAEPLDAATWRAAVAVVLRHAAEAGDPAAVRALGWDAFVAAVRADLPRWGTRRPHGPILRAVWAATLDPAGVPSQRPGALERAGLVIDDWHHALTELAQAQARMTRVLDPSG